MKLIDNIRNSIRNQEAYKKFFCVITFLLIVGAVSIGFCFKYGKYGNLLKIEDYLSYIGSFGGATLGAIASFAVITISIAEQKKQFEEQREIDKTRFEKQRKADELVIAEQKKQFDKDYKLRLIKQKLDTYKEIYLIIEEVINKLVKINHNYTENKYKEESNSIMRDIESVFESHNKLSFMIIFIDEENIVERYENAKTYMFKLVDKTNDLSNQYITENEYNDYWVELHKNYVGLSEELRKVSENIYVQNIKY